MWLWGGGSGRGEPEQFQPTGLLVGGMGSDLVRVMGVAIPIPIPPSAAPSKRPRAMERHEVVIHHRDFNET